MLLVFKSGWLVVESLSHPFEKYMKVGIIVPNIIQYMQQNVRNHQPDGFVIFFSHGGFMALSLRFHGPILLFHGTFLMVFSYRGGMGPWGLQRVLIV